MTWRPRVAAAALALLVLFTAAAIAEPSHHPMRFDRLTLDQGLSQSNVLAVHQDAEGYIWVGTENGLNRYDGYTFKHYRRERGNPEALPNDFIFDIAEDADSRLWLATNGGGLARMDRATGRVTTWRHDADNAASLGGNIVRKVYVDADGSVWAGTRYGGLSRFDARTETFTTWRFAEGNGADSVFAILRDSKGAFWVGGNHGLVQLDTDTGEFDTVIDSGHSVRALFEDGKGTLWVGTYGGGLMGIDLETGEQSSFAHDAGNAASIAGNRVTSIFEDSGKRLWVGTTAGLNLLDRDSGEFARYGNDATDVSSLSGDGVTVIFEDRGGVLWVGTKMRGLNKWNSRTWDYGFEPARALSVSGEQAPSVMAFTESAGTLWVGTFGDGLNAVDRESGTTTSYRHDPSNPNTIGDDRVMSLMRAADGRIWVGTFAAGIAILDAETGKVERLQHDPENPASLSANGVMTMVTDREGRVWVGTFGGGISLYEDGAFTRFAHDPADANTVSASRVTSIAEDANGRMWIGTDGGGLNLYDPVTNQFHHFRHDPENPTALADDTVYSVKVGADGNVWVGTRGGGLDRVVGSADNPAGIHFENRSQADGLSNDVIYGVEIDQAGLLWLSTNYGLSRYAPATDSFKNLHRNDGLQSEEFNFGAHYVSDSGELFFGGTSGYNAFDPSEITVNNVAPSIVLTDFTDGNDGVKSDLPYTEDGSIELSYTQDTVSFEFSALDFSASAKNQYMYKLEGFDKDWIDLGNRRRVTYTDLDDGSYLLRVKAANADGVWNEAGFAVPIRVSPAPWDTWWAYLGYVAMLVQLGLLLWYGHKQKVRREEEYSRRLEKAVAERTDKLSERNQQLKQLNAALQESSLSDPLTGLRNRRFVFEEISRDFDLIRRKNTEEIDGIDQGDAADLVFMMIDLDNFKPINDTYGHAAGDQMLLEVRNVLLSTCRRSDYVIRWGGDEFVVIAKQTKPGECEALAERIRNRIGETNFTLGDGQIVRTTCSIGFAAYPLFKASLDESNLDQVIGLADALMYEAKKHRNAWAGMFGPNEASTSFSVADDELEPTSILFRARRAGTLAVHGDDDDILRLTEAG